MLRRCSSPFALVTSGLVLSMAILGCESAAPPGSVVVRDGRLQPVDADGRSLEPSSIVGTELTVLDPYEQATRVRIEAIVPDPLLPRGPLTLYDTSRWDQATQQWVPYCEVGPDGTALALALAGRWRDGGVSFVEDPADFTLTCTAGASGKCARMGFIPGRRVAGNESLTPYFEACVRMMRADYCGDGRSHTDAGVPVELLDRAGQQPTWYDERLSFEAAWGRDGAVCVHRPRTTATTLEELVDRCPRLRDTLADDCREDSLLARPDVLLVNRSLTPSPK